MAHGGEEEGDALFVGPNLGAFRPGLSHPQNVAALRGGLDGRALVVELVTEDDDELFHGLGGARGGDKAGWAAVQRRNGGLDGVGVPD